jgi:predicted SAM-dependent methyltransferase
MSIKIDIGCGSSKRAGYTGVDILKFPGVDVVHNLDQFPYPFGDNEVEEVWMDQVLEHLKEPMQTVEELYRICKPGAKIFIGVPYFRSMYVAIDPTHRNFFSVYWFNYFDPAHPFNRKYQYSTAKFSVKRIEFDREWKVNRMGFFHRLLIRYAEKNPYKYEMKWSHLLPLNSLTFHLEVIK